VKTTILVAVIAAFPPTLAAILAYLASTRTLRRAIGPSEGVPLVTIVARLEHKIDLLAEGQVAIRERLATLEGERFGREAAGRAGGQSG
jgi:hypothetical protein